VEPSRPPVRIDPEDGRPGWDPARGTPLLPGLLAWRRFVVGHRRETWLCWSVQLWQPAMVKLVRPAWDPGHEEALHREVRALRPLAHPFFPRLVADGTGSSLPHLVTDYFNGRPLDEIIDYEGRLDAADAAWMAADVLSALRYLHASGTAHLDICPDNILCVANQGRLIDLGAARPLGALLEEGEEFGTDGYVAPEFAGWPGGRVTPALDVYSVGAALRRAMDPEADGADAVGEVIERLTDPDPGRRPTPDAALAALVRLARSGRLRPWPWWADRHLARTGRRGPSRRRPSGADVAGPAPIGAAERAAGG
jgi:eukaryotic-like serine/threonine-protein kinase